MKVEIYVSPTLVADLMIGVMEGNSMTRAWCHGVYFEWAYIDGELISSVDDKRMGDLWYADPRVYMAEFCLTVVEILDEAKEPEDDNLARHRCTHLDFAQGLRLMAMKHGRHFGDLMSENNDNITDDVFLQCVALREVRYG